VLVIGTLGSVVSAGMWVRSEVWLDQVAYRVGAAPAPQVPPWGMASGMPGERLYVLSSSGVLILGRGESEGWHTQRRPELIENYTNGPEVLSLPVTLLARTQLDNVFFASITDWQMWGLGVFTHSCQAVVIPWALVMGLFGAPAAVVVWLRRRPGQPIVLTQCEACDYPLGAADVRGVRRCSECGWVAEGPKRT
jgi:hypothetical protein